jgi:leader peptidase (prepilin peptidase)/N-methyltransferase
MNALISLCIFIFGTIIGSFLNVVIYRFNTSRKIANSRSVCFSCNKQLYWYEMIPVLSFLFQKGRCRGCASRISHQYPLVEVVTGLVFVLLAQHFMPLIYINSNIFVFLLSYFIFIFSILIVITVYDIRHKIIPDRLVFVFILLAFISLFINSSGVGPFWVQSNFLDMMAGPIMAFPFAFLWFISGGRWIGLGDAKLIVGIGWMLGFYIGLSALMIAFTMGAIVGIILIGLKKAKLNMKAEIPLAPFLFLGTLIAFISQIEILDLVYLFLY